MASLAQGADWLVGFVHSQRLVAPRDVTMQQLYVIVQVVCPTPREGIVQPHPPVVSTQPQSLPEPPPPPVPVLPLVPVVPPVPLLPPVSVVPLAPPVSAMPLVPVVPVVPVVSLVPDVPVVPVVPLVPVVPPQPCIAPDTIASDARIHAVNNVSFFDMTRAIPFLASWFVSRSGRRHDNA